MALGSVFAATGLLTAAFSTKLWHYFITQGVLPGLANGLMFPMVSLNVVYFGPRS